MAKKGTGKKSPSHTAHHTAHHIVHHHEPHHESHHEEESATAQIHEEIAMNKIMIENFVSLQRVLTNLSVKLDGLTGQISKLLDLFDISAKALAEKDFEVEKDNKKLVEKLDSLLDQNKIIARGVTMVHERMPQPAPMMQPQGMQPSIMSQQPYMRDLPQLQPRQIQPPKRPVQEIPSSPPFSTEPEQEELQEDTKFEYPM